MVGSIRKGMTGDEVGGDTGNKQKFSDFSIIYYMFMLDARVVLRPAIVFFMCSRARKPLDATRYNWGIFFNAAKVIYVLLQRCATATSLETIAHVPLPHHTMTMRMCQFHSCHLCQGSATRTVNVWPYIHDYYRYLDIGTIIPISVLRNRNSCNYGF